MIRTERLTLKKLSLEDSEAVKAILTDRTVKKTYILPDFKTEEELKKMFERLVRYSRSRRHYIVGIYLEKNLIGFINEVEVEGKTIELGYVIHPDHHNRGYMTEALSAAIKELFKKGFYRIVTGVFEENVASIKVMKKCGMRKIKKEEDLEYRGKTHHCLYFAIDSER